MRLAALFSGGKDSVYATVLAREAGHKIRYLVTVLSREPTSWMWHTANASLTELQARAAGIPLIAVRTAGKKEREFDELKIALHGLEIDGLVCGAIASRYQRSHILSICKELGLELLTPLWGQNPEKLLKRMLAEGFETAITAVAAEGFDKSWLGRRLDENAIADLISLNKKYSIHVSGEGGEYETAVLDCPLFEQRLKIVGKEITWDTKTGSGSLALKVMLVPKY
jgi:ABC transporter with metal-binding/Fe-S-binding domain ATP-binding protein